MKETVFSTEQVDTEGRPVDQINRHTLLSIVTPAYNEANNLPLLYEKLVQVLSCLDLDWEWIIIDDHSTDNTFNVISEITRSDSRVRGFRFSRNFGSHKAITCGFQQVRGDCAVVMAADLQDPPETLPALLEKWRTGARVVWAVRERREGEKFSTIGFARLYYFIMRQIVGIREMPETGADFFLIDNQVVKALRRYPESNVSLIVLITWMGFRQTSILYTKKARLYGHSGWNLNKKLKLIVDSVTSFTYLPIRLMSYLGIIVAFIGFLYAGFVIGNAYLGHPNQGWSSLMVVILVVGGIQMLMMGILGEYLWRALDEARQRPHYLIEAVTENTEKTFIDNPLHLHKIPKIYKEPSSNETNINNDIV
jgi:glycosyltransferase involved in cell wall biosynthesis